MVRGRSADHYWGVVIDASDARRLAHFYVQLLDWTVYREESDDVILAPPDGKGYLSFQTQRDPDLVRPVWPAAPGQPQMMMHVDVEVGELDVAVAHAIELGATLAEFQPQENVRVLYDPDGHPFCLYVDA